jgi:hypothetical protein
MNIKKSVWSVCESKANWRQSQAVESKHGPVLEAKSAMGQLVGEF